MKQIIRKILPKKATNKLLSFYHKLLPEAGAILYGKPSLNISVIAVTGTKGKSTVCELINVILEEAGLITALSSTIRFKLGNNSEPNKFKMTMPGRFFLQHFLAKALSANCDIAILEMTSEGVAQQRHRQISLDALVITNISPEHIESHGSYEKYVAAKLKLVRILEKSKKKETYIIINADDEGSKPFQKNTVKNTFLYSVSDAKPYSFTDESSIVTLDGVEIKTKLPGLFNIYNILAAYAVCKAFGVSAQIAKSALEKYEGVPGRMEYINVIDSNKRKLNTFEVIVDYAHTADSLEKVYMTFGDKKKICVLGGTGGGRDKGKRPTMGAVAAKYCSKIYLTNEDPYDEDPMQILNDIEAGVLKENKEKESRGEKPTPVQKIISRKKAIETSMQSAEAGSVVIITGKGTDPYIMSKNGIKTPWSDKDIAHGALRHHVGIGDA